MPDGNLSLGVTKEFPVVPGLSPASKSTPGSNNDFVGQLSPVDNARGDGIQVIVGCRARDASLEKT